MRFIMIATALAVQSTAAFAQGADPAIVATAVPVIADDAPVLPAGATPGFAPPPRDAAGVYVTPNRGLGVEETTWHVRVALNVAALGCRGETAAELVAGYNALLEAKKAVLAATSDGVATAYRARFGSEAQDRQDGAMTRLYNFWALPPAQQAFCATANAVMRAAAAVAPADFPAFAAAALPVLEAPLVAFFAEYDRYRTAQAAWSARHATVVIAAAAAPPVVADTAIPATVTPVTTATAVAQAITPATPAVMTAAMPVAMAAMVRPRIGPGEP